MKKKQKYYPNNWAVIQAAPAEMFPDIVFDQFMEWKVEGWEIPSSVYCIIRTQHLDTGKVKEYVYQRPEFARKKVRKLMKEGEVDISIATHDAIHFVYPEPDDDD